MNGKDLRQLNLDRDENWFLDLFPDQDLVDLKLEGMETFSVKRSEGTIVEPF